MGGGGDKSSLNSSVRGEGALNGLSSMLAGGGDKSSLNNAVRGEGGRGGGREGGGGGGGEMCSLNNSAHG